MSLADVLGAGPPPPKRRNVLLVDRILGSLDKADAEALRTALADPEWNHCQLADHITKAGYPVSNSAVTRWRNAYLS